VLGGDSKVNKLILNKQEITLNQHCANTVLMVSPVHLQFNEQTAQDNEYQQKSLMSIDELRCRALTEFYTMVERLQNLDIEVLVITPELDGEIKPDAIFPNNCFSTTSSCDVTLYPMFTPNRRDEVKREQLLQTFALAGKEVIKVVDLRATTDVALEGTGVLIFDHVNHHIYAGISNRANESLINQYVEKSRHQLITFNTITANNSPVYHTNVLLSIGDNFAVICEQVIEKSHRKKVIEQLKLTKEVIVITEKQMQHFCANILQLQKSNGDKVIVMSMSAYKAFSDQQKLLLAKYGQLIAFDITTIESIGGGSVRCMLAEIFLPNKK